ncbi:MAG: tetratricopeptide repeat protein, partial [Acidobacteriota bacterium]|nr:tetratricopeptide repeat protein [Acidobacteriota bacterium]
KGVSFGLWWFLIAMTAATIVPRHAAESVDRMYIATAGLALAVVESAWLLLEPILTQQEDKKFVYGVTGAIAVLVLGLCGYATYDRNNVWTSENALWEDATTSSPRSAIAFVRYAKTLQGQQMTTEALLNLDKAANLMPDDASDEVELAQAFDSLNKEPQAEEFFKRAISSGMRYSPAYSIYAQWLLLHERQAEAFSLATRAVEMNPWDMDARHVLIDIYSQGNNWKDVMRVANEALAFDPGDQQAQRARVIAQSTFDRLTAAEKTASRSTDVSDFLQLSVAYYENKRFEDSIDACRKALALRPNLVEAYSNMAAAEYALGRNDEAEAALTEALHIDPTFELARRNLNFLEWLKTQKGGQPAKSAPPALSR